MATGSPTTAAELLGDALAAGLLPPTAETATDGRLHVGGVALSDLAERHGTPAFVIDETGIRDAARAYVAAFTGLHRRVDVHFAFKAFPAPGIAAVFASEGLGCDVVGANELALALRGGMPPERILLHGNAKTDADLRAALDAGIGLVVVDSFDDIDRLERLATRPQHVLLRINPGVGASTHEAMATGHEASKFGIPLEQADEAIARIRGHRLLELDGLHSHVGSQILDLDPFVSAVAPLGRHGSFDTYDLGGGLGVRYTLDDPAPPAAADYARAVVAAVHEHLGEGCRIVLEPGRALVARSGVLLYRVVGVKRTPRHTFVSVDGGMGDNLEPMLYGQRFQPLLLDAGERPVELCEVVGPHCETGDRLVGTLPLPEPRLGDLVVLPVAGAYCYTMGNNYNGALRPPVVLVAGGKERTIVRRETLDDLLGRHVPASSR